MTPTVSGDTTRPEIRDAVLLSESSVTLSPFDRNSIIATGSDELVGLTHMLAIYFGHEGPTNDIPSTCKIDKSAVLHSRTGRVGAVRTGPRTGRGRSSRWQHAGQCYCRLNGPRLQQRSPKMKIRKVSSGTVISCANEGVREKVNRCWNKGWDGVGAGSGFAGAIYLKTPRTATSSRSPPRRCQPIPHEPPLCEA